MLTQEELNQRFPEEERKINARYCLGWYPNVVKDSLKEVIIVFDRVTKHIVYKGISNDRRKHYKYIAEYYGEKNCYPPSGTPIPRINPDFYSGY